MKKLLSISLLVAVLTACSTPQTPDFKKIENVRVTKKNAAVYTVTADAVYHNPNSIGGNLTGMEMDIRIDDEEITHLSQSKNAVIQPETDFVVPIVFDVDTKQLFGDKQNFLKGALSKLLNDKLEVTYDGHLMVRFLEVDFKVPVDYSEKISLGLQVD
ncbi:MAG: hypothetical protein JJ975_12830 [Bacteroidia bacterium]|nr:hypothetical protein [Bacteroidia bacterium]